MSQCKIKFCGLSRFSDILAVNQILPDYIGFVFAPSSRQVTLDRAVQLKRELDERIEAVGVFVNASLDEILELTGDGKESYRVIDAIQLHGDEDEAYISNLKSRTHCPIIKAVRVRNREQILKAQELPCDYLLLDTYVKGRQGGSGEQFDWDMIPYGAKSARPNGYVPRDVPEGMRFLSKPFFLAGGIHMENLQRAASLMPYCIDVSSAVETEGRKDSGKMREMAQALRRISRMEELVGNQYFSAHNPISP